MADAESAGADILTEQRMIALAPDHPLARQEKLTLADLRDEPVVGPRGSARGGHAALERGSASGRFEPQTGTGRQHAGGVSAARERRPGHLARSGLDGRPLHPTIVAWRPSSTRRRLLSAWCGCGPHLPRSFRD
ncbi:LysR substrate-binding domain-containing protein [Streptomyces nigra]